MTASGRRSPIVFPVPGHRDGWRATSRWVVFVGVGCASLVAVALTRMSSRAAITLALVVLCAGIALGARRGLVRTDKGRGAPDPRPGLGPEAKERRSDSLFAPRLFYYLGMATIAQLTWRLPLGLTLSDAFFFVSLVLAAAIVLTLRADLWGVVPRTALWLGPVLFAAGGLLSSFGAADQLSSIATLVRFLYLTAVWFVLGAVVLRRREHVERAVWLWVGSAALTGAAAFAQFLFGNVIPSTTTFYGRMTGFTQHVNDLGGVTCIALAPAVMLAMSRSTADPRRLLAITYAVVIGAGLLLSGAVGGMFAASVAIVVLLSSSRSMGRVIFILTFTGVVGVATFAFSSGGDVATPAKRFAVATGAEGTQRDTLATRLSTFREGWQRIGDDPLVGIGLGPSNGTLRSGFQVHNMLLGPWLGAGLLGALGMVVIIVSTAGLVRTGARRARDAREWRLAVGLGASFAALVVFGMGTPVLFQRYGWVSAALVIALVACQRTPTSPSLHGRCASAVPRSAAVSPRSDPGSTDT